jgi:hypothetical protein
MAAVILTDLRIIHGDQAADAATAYACGWRIDADNWWVRLVKAGDPQEAPGDCHIRDGHVFAAGAGAALAFDRDDVAYEWEAPAGENAPRVQMERHPLASRAEQCCAKAIEFEERACAAAPESEKLHFQQYAQLWQEMADFWEALAKRKRD